MNKSREMKDEFTLSWKAYHIPARSTGIHDVELCSLKAYFRMLPEEFRKKITNSVTAPKLMNIASRIAYLEKL